MRFVYIYTYILVFVHDVFKHTQVFPYTNMHIHAGARQNHLKRIEIDVYVYQHPLTHWPTHSRTLWHSHSRTGARRDRYQEDRVGRPLRQKSWLCNRKQTLQLEDHSVFLYPSRVTLKLLGSVKMCSGLLYRFLVYISAHQRYICLPAWVEVLGKRERGERESWLCSQEGKDSVKVWWWRGIWCVCVCICLYGCVCVYIHVCIYTCLYIYIDVW